MADQNELTTQTRPRTLLTRRNVVQTTAWAVPTVTLVSAAPAFAFSAVGGNPTTLAIGSVSATRINFATTNIPVWHNWSSGANPAAANYKTIPAGTAPSATTDPAVLRITISGITATGAGDGFIQVAVKIPGQVTSGTARPAAQYDVTSAGWDTATPTFQGTAANGGDGSRDTTFTFTTSAKVAAGPSTAPGTAPTLTFSVVNASTATSPQVYAWTTKTITASAVSTDATATPTSLQGTSD